MRTEHLHWESEHFPAGEGYINAHRLQAPKGTDGEAPSPPQTELSTAYVKFDLLMVCQKDVGRNPNDHEVLYGEADRAKEAGTGKLPRLTVAGTQAVGMNPGSTTH